jgi:hypothetical protein
MFDPLVLSTILAAVSTICLVLFGLVDFKQWRALDKIGEKVDAFQMGNIGNQFGDWLLFAEKDQPTNLERCATVVAHQIAQSVTMAARGVASGESRLARGVEQKIMEGIESPETKALLEFLDGIGINREYAGIAYDILEKRGILDRVLKNNGHIGGSTQAW